VIYSRDPGEIAYNDARGIAYDWLKRTKGQDGGDFSLQPRRRALRLARGAQVRRQGCRGEGDRPLIDLGVTDKDLKRRSSGRTRSARSQRRTARRSSTASPTTSWQDVREGGGVV
jgi:hypothetical protein